MKYFLYCLVDNMRASDPEWKLIKIGTSFDDICVSTSKTLTYLITYFRVEHTVPADDSLKCG